MKNIFPLFFLSVLGFGLFGQNHTILFQNHRLEYRNGPSSFNPGWAPFFHGVASGDPLEDRVIIWTRVTPEEMGSQPVEVSWKIATDPELQDIVRSGSFLSGPERDYTVKIDVSGLSPNTTYYYGFSALGKNSLTGKTKTTPSAMETEHLKFGVVSCSNFQAGYFNAYHRLAERTDLDAIIHLGDYIYEYGDAIYGDSTVIQNRPLEPSTELLTLEDYRTRYSTYRLDTSLARVHQQHPFISVWDDHESANDAFKDGAENHTETTEGDWESRKAAAKQAYFEWMPIRDSGNRSVFRKISYGNLMDLILLDTRLEGREQQILDFFDPALRDTGRTLLGSEQKAWLFQQLAGSDAKWKVIGQQVIFAELNIGWGALIDTALTFSGVEGIAQDIWDGYPAERSQIIQFLKGNQIDNVVILTGDFHTSFAFDVADQPVDLNFQTFPFLGEVPVYSPNNNYDAATGEGAVAVEFATPSVTSANFDENFSLGEALLLQDLINKPIQPIPGFPSLGNPNPHMKYAELVSHGYFILDVRTDSIQANWYFTDILDVVSRDSFAQAWYTLDGENHLRKAAQPSTPKPVQDQPAPNDPPGMATPADGINAPQKFALLGVYPNPFTRQNTLHYSLAEPAHLTIQLYNTEGKQIAVLLNQQSAPGIFSVQLNSDGLAAGTYFYRIRVDDQLFTARVVLER